MVIFLVCSTNENKGKKELTKTHKKNFLFVVLLFFDMKEERESKKKKKKNLFDNKLYIDEMDGGVYMDGHKIVKEKKKKYLYFGMHRY